MSTGAVRGSSVDAGPGCADPTLHYEAKGLTGPRLGQEEDLYPV